MTSDNIAEYVGENNQFTEKPVTEYLPVIQDNSKRQYGVPLTLTIFPEFHHEF
ncbi:conserved hypothetical protein [Escherichia coli 101-1]|nr:conserved hypothetical protein [Escherichia coli 101-1]